MEIIDYDALLVGFRHVDDGFSRYNWDQVRLCVEEKIPSIEHENAWEALHDAWLDRLRLECGARDGLYTSDNFNLVCNGSINECQLLLRFLERTRRAVGERLSQVVGDDLFTLDVIIFDDHDKYYSYISYYYKDAGEFALSGGIYIDDGYPHIALPYDDLTEMERVVAHEISHFFLSELPLPIWLDEGIAAVIERDLSDVSNMSLDVRSIAACREFWNDGKIHSFWSGESFSISDETSQFSRTLAEIIVRTLSGDRNKFFCFVKRAVSSDAGELAARDAFGVGLGEIATRLLGNGDWGPR